mmetsp:Transcript_41914/g.98278  ORF Transcript_41914/g.98278 Transcript_41914/m.98278 type:complete len:257 (+) Transcript_41914:87-857(+)
MAASSTMRRSRGSCVARAFALAVFVAGAKTLLGTSFAMPSQAKSGPSNKRPSRGTVHNKDTLQRHVEEIPLPEEQPAPVARGEKPPYKPPYTMHIEAHLHGDKPNKPTLDYTKTKVMDALLNTEDFVQHIEVTIQEQEHFHKSRDSKRHAAAHGESVEPNSHTGSLAPFSMKGVVHLKSHKQIVLSNPEKHAQASVTEAVDHFADGLRRILREEKEKEVKKSKHQFANRNMDFDNGDDVLDALAEASEARLDLDDK